ncbi:MAG: GNAT family N-acetyltransferase [Chroococcidiopsidaceae cyanobacterium CP_BM_ER_R8_30]|nr:GNAT family N-acetyltransferase [Chroococcidiopsidaceae cyanobacterium CP_BM_ER_R8_30]
MAHSTSALPAGCTLRLATAQDMWAIRKLVLQAWLDPTQLRCSQFRVIECDGQIVACGQLRSFQRAQELGSVVVAPVWRGRGLGTYLIQHLIAAATQPLYLECLGPRLASFYVRFGFVRVSWKELPRSLKLKFGLSALAATLLRVPVILMQYKTPV